MSTTYLILDARSFVVGFAMLSIAATVHGCGRADQAGNSKTEMTHSMQVAERVFGRGSLEAIKNPERVEAVRLKTDVGATEEMDGDLPKLSSLGTPVAVPGPTASRMAARLLARDTYEFDSPKGCVPTYGVRISFIRGADRTDVFFCFECSILAVLQNDKVVGYGDFDPARAELLKDVQQLFPHDTAIQSLSKW
jgi:hypothetical protein